MQHVCVCFDYSVEVQLLTYSPTCRPYGPGASSQVWPKLFPRGEVWFAEIDAACVEKHWNSTFPWKYVAGDQADVDTLKNWVSRTGGEFDYIVDDGGHTNTQIWNSFTYLFDKALRPDGVYFIEDLHVGRVGGFYGTGIPDASNAAMVEVIADWLDQLVVLSMRNSQLPLSRVYRHPLPENIARIDCVRDMCAITKKGPLFERREEGFKKV